MTIGAPDPVLLLAQAVAEDLASASRGTKFDPATLILLVEFLTVVIPAVVKLIRGCKKTPAEALGEARNPGLFTRVRLNRLVRRHHPADLDIPNDAVVAALLRNYAALDLPAAVRVFGAVAGESSED